MGEPTDPSPWDVLRQHLGEPLPDDVRLAARDALARRDLDAAVASLVLDSADPTRGYAGQVRADEGPRLLSFATAELTIDVEASYDGGFVTLLGQLAPAVAAEIEVDHRLGVLAATPDDLGRFRVEGVECGPVRLRLSPGSIGTVNTEWVLL
jgi:hypothetical protein